MLLTKQISFKRNYSTMTGLGVSYQSKQVSPVILCNSSDNTGATFNVFTE
jgi:hypothetical protein